VPALLRGLSWLHERGYVHRNVKPGNMLLVSHNASSDEHIFLADFGITSREGALAVLVRRHT